ncbi:hypothetical protein Y039_1354 [Burkholderia pseudomallei MSHR1029]|nr:hypothetical protein Y039_1354 [Burkholderia pseudomallei MSHR1029]
MISPSGPYTRKSAYDPDVSRVVGVRISPELLKRLRFIAAERDLTVCSLLRKEAERLVSESGARR